LFLSSLHTRVKLWLAMRPLFAQKNRPFWCHFGLPLCQSVPFREFLPATHTNASTFFLGKMTRFLIPKKHPDSDRVFALRRYLIGFLFILIFVLLDRTTVYLQVLPGISAWYPPVGMALALLLGMGPRYAPLLLVGWAN